MLDFRCSLEDSNQCPYNPLLNRLLSFSISACLGGQLLLTVGTAFAQADSDTGSPLGDDLRTEVGPGDGELSVLTDYSRLRQRIDTAIENLSSDSTGETTEASLGAQYRRLSERLDLARIHIAEAESSRQFVSATPELVKKLKRELTRLRDVESSGVKKSDNSASIEKLQSTLNSMRSELVSLDNDAVELERELNSVESRPGPAREELSELREQIVEAVVARTPAEGSESNRLGAEVDGLATTARIDALEHELLAIGPRAQVLRLRQQISELRRAQVQDQLRQVETQVSVLRRQRASAVGQDVDREQKRAESENSPITSVYSQNADFAKELGELEVKARTAGARLTSLVKRRKDQFNSFKSARERIDAAGSSGAIGELLKIHRKALPLDASRRFESASRVEEIEDTSVQHFIVLDHLKNVVDIDSAQATLITEFGGRRLSDSDRNDLRRQVIRQRDILESLDSTYTRYLETLSATEFEYAEFNSESTIYRRFLDERLLWVPNTEVIGLESPKELFQQIGWLLDHGQWRGLVDAILNTFDEERFLFLFIILAVVLLTVKRRSLIKLIEESNRDIASVRTDRFRHTVTALFFTLLLCLPLPLFIAALGRMLSKTLSGDILPVALGQALIAIVPLLFVLQFVVELCRPSGVASVHFRWSGDSARFLRNNVRWFAIVFVAGRLAWYVAAGLIWTAEDFRESAVGSSEIVRLAALVSLGALAWFVYLVFGPGRPLLAPILSAGSRVWVMRLSYVWFPMLVITPLIMMLLVLFGYLYTTNELLIRLEYSLFLIVAAFTFEALFIRGLNVAQRRLAFSRAKARWEARSNTELETSAEGSPITLADAEIDIATIDSQSRKFIRTLQTLFLLAGLWLIWSRMLPFFGDVTDVELWRSNLAGPGGTDIAVNLRDIVSASLVALVAWFAARNLPALLEIAVLQRLPLEAGSRYAIARLVQYSIVVVAVLYIFSSLGISWSKVQWLVAALGVGIGFGLQEIFANFISGLIILFERPVRLGDTITIGNLSGTVSRIRLRTTTIIDWDSKEIVVPNKHLITDRLVNWTLSDSVTRVVIPFGVAYGTDVDRTFSIVKDIAEEHPAVLDNPPVQLFLLSLGASSLDFELRVFVSQLSERLPVTHDLLKAIEKTFATQNIEIPFPQQELRVRNPEAGSIEILPNQKLVAASDEGS